MKDARGHGSNPRGALAAHQSGISKIDRQFFTPLGLRAIRNHPYQEQFMDTSAINGPGVKTGSDWSGEFST